MVYTALLIPILAFLERVYAPPTKLYAPLSTSSFVGRASACPDIESGSRRSLWSIINGCLLTIFACTSVSFHPDVPNQTHSPWRIRLIHLNCLLHAFLYPEMIVLKAASQWWRVVEYELPFQGWTRAHSFFLVMGGFSDSKQSSGSSSGFFDGSKSSMGLNPAAPMGELIGLYPEMLSADAPADDSSKEGESSPESSSPPLSKPSLFMRLGSLFHPFRRPVQGSHSPKPWILVQQAEILDKSKSDALGKFFAVLQTTWFVVQYCERWAARQPRTQLEVDTLAFTALNILVYLFWWDKPKNVREPIDVRGRPSAPTHAHKTEGVEFWDIMYDTMTSLVEKDENDWILATVLPAVGILFGGIHCLAWDFPFPTVEEKVLWRVSAVCCTAFPFAITAFQIIAKTRKTSGLGYLADRLKAVFKIGISQLCDFEVAFMYFLLSIYIVCRITLAVLTFTCLRALPSGVFEATSWTSIFPHFG